MIKNCLQVSPLARPTCEKILSLQVLSRNLSDTMRDKIDFGYEEEDVSPSKKKRLLNTIRVPKDMGMISERLPKPQYHINTERSSKMSRQLKRNNSVPNEMDRLPEIQQQ